MKGPVAAETKSVFVLSEKRILEVRLLTIILHFYKYINVFSHHQLSFSIILIFLLDYANIVCILVPH